MEVVRAITRMPGMLFDWLAGALAGLLSIGVTATVLAGVHPLLVLPVVAAVGFGPISAATAGGRWSTWASRFPASG